MSEIFKGFNPKQLDLLNKFGSAEDQDDLSSHIKGLDDFFKKGAPGSSIELTRLTAVEANQPDNSGKRKVRDAVMDFIGAEGNGDISHPEGIKFKITYDTDFSNLQVGFIMNLDNSQVYQLELAVPQK